jgi:drug/metabolite transporter (DMT)-like permease
MSTAFIQTPPPFLLAGELASLAAAFIWAGSVTAYRHWGREVAPYSLNLLKSLVAFVCLGLSLAILRPPAPAASWVWLHLALSGIVGLAIGDTAFFASLRRLGAQAASCGMCLSPPFTVAIAAFYLGETLTARKAAGVALTVLAVAGVSYFGKRGRSPLSSLPTATLLAGLFFVALAALANAVGLVIARFALQEVHVVWGTAIRITPALLALIVHRGLHRGRASFAIRTRSPRVVGVLAFTSFCGTFVGLLLFTTGTKYAEAGVAAALTGSFPLWVVPISRSFLNEHTNWQCVLCTILAVGGVALILIP